MKGLMKYLAVGLSVLIMAALLVGCAKPPTQEMDAAKVAMDGAVSAGAGTYAKDGLKNINDAQAAMQDEIKKQEGKLFKNYDNAKAMIAKITGSTDTGTGRWTSSCPRACRSQSRTCPWRAWNR